MDRSVRQGGPGSVSDECHGFPSGPNSASLKNLGTLGHIRRLTASVLLPDRISQGSRRLVTLKTSFYVALTIAAAMPTAFCGAATTLPLVNGDFETGPYGPIGTIPGWTVSGNAQI